jgi:sterol desaturase/sphingolipid hydroxylase (fatty acid hydroxylase superfamily)
MQFALYGLPVAFLVLLALEQAFPLRKAKRPLWPRLRVNFCVAILALTVAAILVKPAASARLEQASRQSFGLVPLLPLPEVMQWVIGFLLLDLSFYYWHRANHGWRFLWRFHNAHHIDPDLDVSTAYRFHFVEIGFSAGFVIQIVLIGGQPWSHRLRVRLPAQHAFQHSNVRLPIAVELGASGDAHASDTSFADPGRE